jgi:hypothetical protein
MVCGFAIYLSAGQTRTSPNPTPDLQSTFDQCLNYDSARKALRTAKGRVTTNFHALSSSFDPAG